MEGEANSISSVFTWSIENFSTLIYKIYSQVFLACGYRWQLVIYPKGNGVGIDSFSLYLRVAGSEIPILGWSINGKADLFVVDQVSGQATRQRDFSHEFRAEESSYGYPEFMSLSELYDPNKGFLVNDTLIIKACVTTARRSITSSTFTWAIKNFSGLSERLHSNSFMIGRHQWKLAIHPKRSRNNTNNLEVILHLADSAKQPHGWSRYTNYNLSVIDQVSHQNTVREEFQYVFNATPSNLENPPFMEITHLNDPAKGFLVNDTLIIQACVSDGPANSIPSVFTWSIENFSRHVAKIYSQIFLASGYRWQLVIYPKGFGPNKDKLSVYLCVADLDCLPLGWTISCKADLSVVDQGPGRATLQREFFHKFRDGDRNWGYPAFMSLCDLNGSNKGFIVNDTLIMKACVTVAQDDTRSSIFTWTIEEFSTLKSDMYSTTFVAGSYAWRLRIYPKGDSDVDKLGLYIYVADSDNQPLGWSRYVHYKLSVVNHIYSQYTVQRELDHKFNAQSSSWGYSSFMRRSDLYDPTRGFLVNDLLIVKVEIYSPKIVEYHSYNSKKETGHVGLKSHGSTSYINSLLQSLFHIPYFRKFVYNIPGAENGLSLGFISLALQSLFYELQHSEYSVSAKYVTKYLGWDVNGNVMQHDVQKLHLQLCEKLGDELKTTNLDGGIQELFMGHQINYMDCLNFDYRACREESFYGLQLDVKGCRDVYASFDKYVGIVNYKGDNKYSTDKHGLQDAKKGVLFVDFPPVLHLQLKRFDYDFIRADMVKIYDRYEFPLELDLDRENGKYLSPYADWKIRNLYTLHSVLVHNGGVDAGRCHVFVRPTLSDQWLNFDDERVAVEVMASAVQGQYGGEEEPELGLPKLTNACMLVYIRNSEIERIMSEVDKQDIAEHLQLRLKKEQDEKERKKKEGQCYTTIKVSQNKDILAQLGRDKYFDLVDHDKVRHFHINNSMRFCAFKEEVAKEFGIPVQFQRFWLWKKRENNTDRLSRHITPAEERQSVGHLRELPNESESHSSELKLFLEVELDQDLHPTQLAEKTEDDILLFFKLYDPIKEELRSVGRIFVKKNGFPSEILSKLNQMAGFSPVQRVELYKEVRFEPNVVCKTIDKMLTFGANQLADGDIIYFQTPPAGIVQQCIYPNISLFMEFLHNRQVVRFRSLDKPEEEDFSLELSKLSFYYEVVKRVACVLNVNDPTRIRITPHVPLTQMPKPTPIEPRGRCHLSEMLVNGNQTSDILYYKVLSPAAQASAPPSCVICLDAPLEGACVPCGHLSGCMSCLNEIKNKSMGCPICRKKIQTVVRIYSA